MRSLDQRLTVLRLIKGSPSEGQAAYSIIRKQDMPTPPAMPGRQHTVEQSTGKIRQHQINGNNPGALQDQLFLGCDGRPSSH